MPFPIGHAAVGWAVYQSRRHDASDSMPYSIRPRLVHAAYVAALANLPDLDVLFGLIVFGNGAAIHRGPTHSLLFAVLTGYLASKGWRLWPRIPRFGFSLCFFTVFSHVLADWLLTDAPVSFLWPFELHLSQGHSGWLQITHMVLFQSIQDIGLILACLLYVITLRSLRRKTPALPSFAFARRRGKEQV